MTTNTIPTSALPEFAGAASTAAYVHTGTLGETLRNAMVVARREMRDSFRDWRIMMPIFFLTLVFPGLAQGMTGLFTEFFVSQGAEPMLEVFLPLMPMIVGFFPISISLVIALETFVGEKERRSLEPLLSTPLTNMELYIGKTAAATVPPLLASYLGMGLYLASLILGAQQWRPHPELIIQLVLITTTQAIVMVTGAVVISSQTTSTRASNLLASFIIIPVSLLVLTESYMMVTNRRHVLWLILAALVVADVMLFSMGARIFNREELLGRSIDSLNLRRAWRLIRTRFTGGQKSIPAWYRYSVIPTLRHLRAPLAAVFIAIVAVFIVAFVAASTTPSMQLPMTLGATRGDMMNDVTEEFGVGNPSLTVRFVIEQNLRVLIGGMLLGTFTFGVMSIFLAVIPFGLLGLIFAQPLVSSLGIGIFIGALIPHTLFEMPAILISSAAAVRLGAIVTRPPAGKGVWDAWLDALADWLKLFVGLVVPLLIIAALVEVYITPRVVYALLAG